MSGSNILLPDYDAKPAEIIFSPSEITDLVREFTPYTIKLFNYLNERISPMNPCNLVIDIFDPRIYAGYRKPNIIEVYLGSIINNNISRDCTKKDIENVAGITALVIAHELYHASQYVSMVSYGADQQYAIMIEHQAEYMAEQFLLNHREDCIKLFNFDPKKLFVNLMDPPKIQYRNFQAEDYYIGVLTDIVYRNSSISKTLKQVFDGEDTLYLLFNAIDPTNVPFDKNCVLIKMNGQFLESSIPLFNFIINENFRCGRSLYNYTLDTQMIAMDRLDGSILWINAENRVYRPVTFVK